MRELTTHDIRVHRRKKHYPTEINAEAAARRFQDRWDRTDAERQIPYQCPVCGLWCLRHADGFKKRPKKDQVRARRVGRKPHKDTHPMKPPPPLDED